MHLIAMAFVAFLAGSFPSGLVLGGRFTGRDIREHGSGNFGASNVADAAGMKVGVAVGVLDMLKGFVPVLISAALGFDHLALATVALAAVLGHDFSLYLRFRGGKGVATTFGVALALAPIPALVASLVWLAVHEKSRYASVASMVSLGGLPIFMQVTGGPRPYVLLAILLFVLCAAKHWENIVRLSRGEERSMERSLPRRPLHGK